MRAFLCLGALSLAACSAGDANAPQNDAGPGDDAADDQGPIACNLTSGIDVTGAPIPGQKVTLAIHDAGSKKPYTTTWTVPSGQLSQPTGATVDLTLASTLAVHTAETITVSAVASAPGCNDEMQSKDIVVDWTDPLRTLVVYNTSFAGSKDVADYYAAFRNIPASHECAATYADMNTVANADYPAFSKTVTDCVAALGPYIHTIVPVWGVPYMVANRIVDIADNVTPRTTSLDALMAFGTASIGMSASVNNPYYQVGNSLTGVYKPYVPFGVLRNNKKADYFMVARIDGADATAAKALVDRTKAAEALVAQNMLTGVVYVDGNKGLPHPTDNIWGSYDGGEWTIIGVENVFNKLAWPSIVADYNGAEFGTAPAPLTAPNALYYAGWYSYNHYNDVFTWSTGAIGGHLDSCSACDIRGTTSWSAAALRKGITATFGAVGEPYVAGLPAYDQFFLYLTSGGSFGEAGAEGTVLGAWMVLWVGDPLYRPYGKK